MRCRSLVYLELFKNLLVSFEDLDCIPSLHVLGKVVDNGFLDVGQRMLDGTGEGVKRNGLSFLCRLDRRFGCEADSGSLQCRDLQDRASDFL